MSELEIQKRQEYMQNRKKWTMIQLIAIVVLVAISLAAFLIYNRIDQTQYVEYTEKSEIGYKVQYKQNDFFDSEWIGQDQSYISSLVSSISADFLYNMDVGSDSMNLEYEYWINAKLVIANKNTNAPYYTVEDRILPMKSAVAKKAPSVNIMETVFIDYAKYDKIARSFIDTYDLKDGTSSLTVTLNVKTNCSNKNFANDCQNAYSTSLNIPLASDTFSIHSTFSSPASEIKSFEYQGIANRSLFLIIGIVTISLAALLVIALLIFLHLTKNEDITYTAKVRKIFNSYSSFIQRINGEFDSEGYQIVMIKTFTELLGIRDTIQSPVLAFENSDETMTKFFIPTNTRILYVFEIKVDNYDEIYSRVDEPEIIEEVD